MNKIEQALNAIQVALDAVDKELARLAAGQEAVGTAAQLQLVRQKLAFMAERLRTASTPARSQRDAGMGRMISDSWPIGSTVGELVLRAENLYVAA